MELLRKENAVFISDDFFPEQRYKTMKKIILLGDSIRQGYDKYTQLAFEGQAQVLYPTDNCRFASFLFRSLHNWKDVLKWGDDADCVHWNAGLWDCLTMQDGETLTPCGVYAEYIDRISRQIIRLFPQAKVIFATSTPVIEELFLGECKRYNADVERFNTAAVEVVRKYGFAVNDLYALAKDVPRGYHSDMTHFYTKEGTRLLTDRVTACIGQALDIKPKALDYDALFAGTKAIGI